MIHYLLLSLQPHLYRLHRLQKKIRFGLLLAAGAAYPIQY